MPDPKISPASASLADELREVTGLFPASLAGPSELNALLQCASTLPKECSGALGFEVDLGDPKPGVDLIVTSKPDLAPALLPWGEQYSRYFNRAMLEYDLRSKPPSAPPRVFVFPETEAGFLDAPAAFASLIRFSGNNPQSQQMKELEQQFDKLSRTLLQHAGVPFALGIGPASEPPQAKCEIRLMPAQVATFFRTLHLTLDSTAWKRAAGLVDESAKWLRLSIDLSPETYGEIGLLIYGHKRLNQSHIASWRSIFSKVQEAGLCQPHKVRAVLSWFGARPIFTNRGLRYASCWINHLKLRIRQPSAKAYLGLIFLPCP